MEASAHITPAFGQALRSSRLKVGLSQAKLGELLGLTGKTICLWEQGAQVPNVRVLATLMDAMGLEQVQRLVWIELLRAA